MAINFNNGRPPSINIVNDKHDKHTRKVSLIVKAIPPHLADALVKDLAVISKTTFGVAPRVWEREKK